MLRRARSLSEAFTSIGWGIAALAVGAACVQAPAAWAQGEGAEETEGAAAAEAEEGEEQPAGAKVEEAITVTGTRFEGRVATETPAPVDYIAAETIATTGATEVGKILQLLAPSFNFSTTFISDGSDAIRPATLRGLGADQVLVLINGKRRHATGHLNVQQTVARGESGVDINAIPAASIDHIEVLRDGAAAQYGSDAIAGVINIILKDQTRATQVTVEGGETYESDGEVLLGSVNTGFRVGEEGFVNLTAEYRDRSETNRAGADSLRVDPPRVTQRIGDPDAKDILFWLNSGFPTENGEFYLFGGWSQRETNSSGFFRSAGDGRTVPDIYPNGFLPTIITEPRDTALVLGYRGTFGDGWTYDVSADYGASEFKFREENTVNVSYWYEPLDPGDPTGPRFMDSPLAADTGTLKHDQLVFNLDFTKVVEWGVGAGPLFLALGAEWREQGYEIEPGAEVSYEYGRTDDRSIVILNQLDQISQPGTQGFPGWSPREAVDDDRSNVALYADFESQLAEKFLGGVAVRYEDYSDFGSTVDGKLSGRFEVTDRFSLRGTASTGFRAPGVQQLFFSQRSTNLNAAGVLTDTLTARNNSDVTNALGIPPLKEETSQNYSFGFVAEPNDDFRITLDLYRIDIDDRIIFSSNIQPEDSSTCGVPFDPALCPIRAILDPIGAGQILFFTNAVDTQTDGLDLVLLYDWRLGDSLLTLEGAAHCNDTEVTDIKSLSDVLAPEILFDQAQVTLVEEGQPGERYILGGTYYWGPVTASLRFNFFGEVAGEGFTPGFKQTWSGQWVTDLSVRYAFNDALSLTMGGLNIFDEFPDQWDEVNAFPFPQLGFVYGWETLPFGINGGYYFTRLNYRFDHGR